MLAAPASPASKLATFMRIFYFTVICVCHFLCVRFVILFSLFYSAFRWPFTFDSSYTLCSFNSCCYTYTFYFLLFRQLLCLALAYAACTPHSFRRQIAAKSPSLFILPYTFFKAKNAYRILLRCAMICVPDTHTYVCICVRVCTCIRVYVYAA